MNPRVGGGPQAIKVIFSIFWTSKKINDVDLKSEEVAPCLSCGTILLKKIPGKFRFAHFLQKIESVYDKAAFSYNTFIFNTFVHKTK